MDRSGMLRTGHLYDCHGHTTHTFVLEIDGRVTVTFPGGHAATVDPTARRCHTPGFAIPDALWSDICAFARP